jgi:hypothetical protein
MLTSPTQDNLCMVLAQAALTENGRPGGPQTLPCIDDRLADVLAHFPGLLLALPLGSVASDRANAFEVNAAQ